jgi:hypothetical protein
MLYHFICTLQYFNYIRRMAIVSKMAEDVQDLLKQKHYVSNTIAIS